MTVKGRSPLFLFIRFFIVENHDARWLFAVEEVHGFFAEVAGVGKDVTTRY